MSCCDLGGSDSFLSHVTERVIHGYGHISLLELCFALNLLPRYGPRAGTSISNSVFSHREVVSTA